MRLAWSNRSRGILASSTIHPSAWRSSCLASRMTQSPSTGHNPVIYDAEDRPEAGQLRWAAAAFRAAAPHTVCLQARLDFHNGGHNWLTRCFTLEYGALFRLLLPGLAERDLPVPLGGTSNH